MRLRKLRTKSSAATSNTSDSAICVMTMIRVIENRSRLAVIPRPHAIAGVMRVARTAGAMPKTMQVAAAMTTVKTSTRQLGEKRESGCFFGGRNRPEQRTAQNLRQRDAQDCSSRCEQTAFSEKLSQEPRARRAERQPHRDLPIPCDRAGQEQIRKVHARNQQHETGDREEQFQGGIVSVSKRADTRRCGVRPESKRFESFGRARAVSSRRHRLEDAGAERVEMSGRAIERPVRPETSHDRYVEYIAPRILSTAERNRDVEALAHRKSEESRGRHAEDLMTIAVQDQLRIATDLTTAELTLPEAVTEDDATRRARGLVRRLDHPSAPGLNPEHLKELATHHEPVHTPERRSLSNPHVPDRPREHTGERLLMRSKHSPDGTRLMLYWNRPQKRGLWLIDLRTARETPIEGTANLLPIGWSIDGASIHALDSKRAAHRGLSAAFGETVTEVKILSVPLDGDQPTTIVELPFDEVGGIGMFPDGRRFVCAVYSSRSDVWIVQNFDVAAGARFAPRAE